jgi:hypothetical protein
MILTFDGPTVLLLTQFFFLGEALGHLPRSRLLGLAALAILAIATAPLALIPGIAGSSAVLVAAAIAETLGDGDQAPSRSGVAALDEQAAVADRRRSAASGSPGCERLRSRRRDAAWDGHQMRQTHLLRRRLRQGEAGVVREVNLRCRTSSRARACEEPLGTLAPFQQRER